MTRGTPLQVLHWILDHGVLIFSDATFDELASRFQKPKFDRYVSQERRRALLADLHAVAEWITITGALQVCADPDDDKFIETALAAQADCLVSGDGDLLALGPFDHLGIVTPAGLMEAVSD